MSEQDLAIAEARLLQAACAYVDGQGRVGFPGLMRAVAAYRAALRAQPASDDLVARGMRVVRRLLAEQERTT